ncbi:MAG: HAMP domain-containing histidine kinase [Bacteroidales bacterium]|jgi:signal transduction histidine kinase|nr:HAMP domain-containing histidine kinase [Bacteroidales bacterium]
MNVYGNKKQFKFWLIASAVVVFVVIILYSNHLITNMANEERHRIEIWADAITYKAELVNYTEKFFERIKIEEGKRASIFAQALQKVNEASFDEDLTFYQSIISSNSTIPSIMVHEDGKIDCAVNVDFDIQKLRYIWELTDYQNKFDSIKIQYDRRSDRHFIMVYYKESKIYTDLKVVLNNLISSFFQEIVINSASVPVIITDKTEQEVIAYGNIDSTIIQNQSSLKSLIEEMRAANHPIKIDIPNHQTCYVFYEESSVLQQLRFFPFIQLAILLIFVAVAYLLFSMARKSEQNQVWVGMSKETAHQLGTPISSLMAWNELLKEQDIDPSIIKEIEKDVNRLETISQRFSKIGSVPELKDENLIEVIDEFVNYLTTRLPGKVSLDFIKPKNNNIVLPLNRYLFEWVIENLCKNSADAMSGKGAIFIEIAEEPKVVHVDIRDTGKGIPSSKINAIFNPGYTTKSRGWGLGLTLSARIIKEYHKGKLFVKSSTAGVGTVMRITLKKGYPK